MDEGHSLICGTTMSGKTTLAQILAHEYRANDICTIVLDPFKDPKWGNPCDSTPEHAGHMITSNSQLFLATAKAPGTIQCALFADEGSESVGHYAGPMRWLATMARHWGHKSHFITQAPQTLDPVIRAQCSQAFIFRVNQSAMKILADEYCQPEILKAGELEKGEFIYVARFGKPRRGRVDFARRKIVFNTKPSNTPPK